MKRLIELGFLACLTAAGHAYAGTREKPTVMESADRLGPGQFVWSPDAVSTGPVLLVIDLTRQRVLVYRGGVPVAASTISSGSKGRETPIGEFTILQKEVVHRSRTYDDAPMPYMQRLTEKGVAMHGGNLPGYPASHGCIRLPRAFAKLLYGVTDLGTPVVITDAEQEQRVAEYQAAVEDVAQKLAGLHADAERALAESHRAMAEHEEALKQHDAKLAKYKSEVASK
ncbi:L,D-transpeptidase family protein [Sphingomonas alba]|uniref:L,D-transpeptidase family protein n=1 Tax=Sphingomonas alba TaxID=2908208 RepID=A0ABT0RK36_9SPHN|nr:L,D-transpeptidase family protein [Sphingomonas alba]